MRRLRPRTLKSCPTFQDYFMLRWHLEPKSPLHTTQKCTILLKWQWLFWTKILSYPKDIVNNEPHGGNKYKCIYLSVRLSKYSTQLCTGTEKFLSWQILYNTCKVCKAHLYVIFFPLVFQLHNTVSISVPWTRNYFLKYVSRENFMCVPALDL